MSTKKTREALKRLHSMLPTTETNVASDALAEVEAIEEACRVLDNYGVVHSMRLDGTQEDDEVNDAADFLCTIGRTEEDAP